VDSVEDKRRQKLETKAAGSGPMEDGRERCQGSSWTVAPAEEDRKVTENFRIVAILFSLPKKKEREMFKKLHIFAKEYDFEAVYYTQHDAYRKEYFPNLLPYQNYGASIGHITQIRASTMLLVTTKLETMASVCHIVTLNV
jgi:hypothetical protein